MMKGQDKLFLVYFEIAEVDGKNIRRKCKDHKFVGW